MQTASFRITFNTPAFLGNAEQSGQWRTPPIKALLRQFWRMAYAANRNFNVDVARMRHEEGLLFGHAWLENDTFEHNGRQEKTSARKSQMRIRLSEWSDGKLKVVPAIGKVSMGKNQIPAALYSGYGPIEKGPRLKGNAAIQPGESAEFRLAFPDGQLVEQAIALMHQFGTLGGRSRNGWGSFALEGDLQEVAVPLQDWKAAMQFDWPHAIGNDEKGSLIWQSESVKKWEDAMRLLAQTRADLRRAVPDRLMLAYPDTKGTMPGWGKDDRVPNSVRFKVRRVDGGFIAVVFHMSCRPADELWNKLRPQQQQGFITCFTSAHAFLDRQNTFTRSGK
ncbi:MAG: hypothetical protein QM599_03895 [Pseudoxanthomonas sp.]